MQAQLEIRRSPSTLFALIVMLAATLLLGGTLGYVFKPATFVSGPSHVVVVPAGQGNLVSDDNRCSWTIKHHKEC